MNVTDLIITKNADGTKTYEARITDSHAQTINISFPAYTAIGMNGKMNRSATKALATTERKVSEQITIEITKEEACSIRDEAIERIGEGFWNGVEQQSDTVTIIRL